MSDVDEVTQLVLHERQGRDRSDWDQMRRCLAPDARVRLSWFRGSGADFITESANMADRGDLARHRLAPLVVDLDGDRAFVEVPAAIEIRTDLDGVEVDLVSYARLLYRAERRSGQWQITSLDPIYERDTLAPALPGATPRVRPEDVAGFRPPYRMLSYVLGRRGYAIGDDLYGDDRPAEVAEVYRAARAWLAG